jgi:glutathione S-transferase
MFLIYGNPLSSPSNKVRFLAHYLHIPYEFKVINLVAGEHKQADFLKVNTYGKIPAIDDNGFKLAESNAILRYLANKHKSNLYPSNLEERALVDQWMDFASGHIALASSKLLFNRYICQLVGIAKDERAMEDGQEWLDRYLPVLEQQLTKHAFLAGSHLTLADFSLLAALDVAEVVDLNLKPFPHLTHWRNKLMQESFYQDCHSSYKDVFDKILGAHLNKA